MAEPAQLWQLTSVFQGAIGAVLGFAGIGLFVMLVTGGLQFTFAGGDPKAQATAWKTITFAVIGLALTAGAYLILNLIVGFTGANELLNFDVYLGN